MNRITVTVGSSLLSMAAIAQTPAPAMPAGNAAAANADRPYISAAEIADRSAKAEAAAKSKTPYNGGPLLAAGSFRANMEWRDAPATAVNIHETDAELFVVVEGNGTMTLGGTLVNPTRNGTNLSAASVTGGKQYKLAKGDMVLVPENTAHAVTAVDGKLVMMSLHLPRPAAAPADAAPAPAR